MEEVSLTKLQPNQNIPIKPEEDLKLVQLGRVYLGRGSIEFKWSPKPGYYFKFQGGDEEITRGEATLGGFRVIIHSIKRNGNFECKGVLSNGIRWGNLNGQIDNLSFVIPNFGIDPIKPLTLTYKTWDISLFPFENITNLFEYLDENDGFAITYSGRIRCNVASNFTWEQVKFLIRPLRMFLSFVRGAWCDLLFHCGSLNDNLVFQSFLKPLSPLTRWTRQPQWCNNHLQQDLNKAFNRFMEFYEEGQLEASQSRVNAYDHMSAIITMCIGAGNLEIFGETAIMITQSCLESLAYMKAETVGKIFDENESADLKIRWMLERMDIGVDIPPEAKDLQYYLNIKKNIIPKPRDGPKAITYLRNGIIHPSPENLIKPFGTETDRVSSQKAMDYIIVLGRMYMELAILHMLSYNGNYTNRLNRITQQVPLKGMALSQILREPNLAETSPVDVIMDSQITTKPSITEKPTVSPQVDDQFAVRKILKKRFKDAPLDMKQSFPDVISREKLKYFLMECKEYLLLIFVDEDDKKRIANELEQKNDPFPGLITYDPNSQFLYRLDGSRNYSLQDCTASGIFTFLYGKDATIILKNHQQTINITDHRTIQYTIKLAYLVTFGNEITNENKLDFLDELISCSINEWRANFAQ